MSEHQDWRDALEKRLSKLFSVQEVATKELQQAKASLERVNQDIADVQRILDAMDKSPC